MTEKRASALEDLPIDFIKSKYEREKKKIKINGLSLRELGGNF